MIRKQDVETVFRALLKRSVEPAALEEFSKYKSISEIIEIILGSDEYSNINRQIAYNTSPFAHFSCSFDAVNIVRKYEDSDRQARRDFHVNYFGVAVPISVLPREIKGHLPAVEVDPLPNNWHADAAEFAAALRAVDLAKSTFTMLELGCGWGCWMNITGAAARRRKLRVHLVGVEGDRHNLSMASKALAANFFTSREYRLLNGIVAAVDGKAAFPQQGRSDESWGLEPVFCTNEVAYEAAMASGRYRELKTYSLETLIDGRGRLDLVHIDIQGGELEYVRSCLASLNSTVAYLVIGTHSRCIESELLRILSKAGWRLEVERPCIFEPSSMKLIVDGVQGWRNTRTAKE